MSGSLSQACTIPAPRRRRPRAWAAALAAVVALMASGVAAQSAQAEAEGCTASGFGVPKLGLSSTYTCLELNGGGLTVDRAAVYWSGGGMISNYEFKIRWYDRYGNLYHTSEGPYHSGSRFGYADFVEDYPGGVTRQEGRACGELYVSGVLRAGVPCLAIFP